MERVKRRSVCRVLVRKHEGGKHFENLDVDGRIILRWILEKLDRRMWI
jgi:hypothetical protein